MRVSIHDSLSLKQLTPSDITSYLQSQGWMPVEGQIRPAYAMWALQTLAEDTFEIMVPLEPSYRDYVARVSELLSTLEIVEERSQIELWQAILTATDDIVRIRPDIGVEKNDSISIEQGAALVQQTRDMLLAVACATVKPASYFPSRKPAQANNYVKQARFGQTERGSFVLTVQSSVSPIPGDNELGIDTVPFNRRVMQTFFRSLNSVRNAAVNGISTGNYQPFVDAVPQGISANLCNAIAALHSGTNAYSISFGMTWARVRPPEPGIERLIEIPKDAIPVIEEAGRYLKSTSSEDNDIDVQGVPSLMGSSNSLQGGEVVVRAFADGRWRRVHIRLTREEYIKAVNAHTNNQPIKLQGTLTKEGRSYVLQQPSEIEIDEEIDESEGQMHLEL